MKNVIIVSAASAHDDCMFVRGLHEKCFHRKNTKTFFNHLQLHMLLLALHELQRFANLRGSSSQPETACALVEQVDGRCLT